MLTKWSAASGDENASEIHKHSGSETEKYGREVIFKYCSHSIIDLSRSFTTFVKVS